MQEKGKIIKLSPSGEKVLAEAIINEYTDFSKEGAVVKYLNAHYAKPLGKITAQQENEFGEYVEKPMVVPLDANLQPVENKALTLEQLFERLQYRFQKLFADKTERDTFLKQVIDDWYYNNISKFGSLSKY